ncbi:MAG: RDD family protein, partial [Candidatus Hydrogenedentes bacterium]|nr:RDD family protein [Candidatus Hydrogenedentota bacterium]
MRSAWITTLPIRTPDGIAFSLVLAGPISRFLAWGIDLGVQLVF